MSHPPSRDESAPHARGAERPSDPARREFLGSAAAMAAVAVGAPLLASCDAGEATGPATAAAPEGPRASHAEGGQPWWTLHHKLAATIGAAENVKVPELTKTTGGFLQRIVTDDDRTGTGLATVLRTEYAFDNVYVTVSVESSGGKRWPPRTIYEQSDLVYAMKDALATNTLTDGVLRESLSDGNPVIAIVKASVLQFWDGVASDYYGNHLQVASRAFCDVFSYSVGSVRLGSTTRDFSRS